VGHVFQGRYKAIVCEKDEYLLQLIRYIHVNPVRAGMVKDPERYTYSSERAYVEGKATGIIDPRKVLTLIGGKTKYRKFVRDGLGQGHDERYYEVEDQRFLGAEGFGETLREEEVEPKPHKREPIDGMMKRLGKELKVGIPELVSADRSWRMSKARTMIAYVLVRRQGYGLRDVARYFHRDIATIGTLLGRFAERMQTNPELRQEIGRLNKKVES
jgi:hypothetical protein